MKREVRTIKIGNIKEEMVTHTIEVYKSDSTSIKLPTKLISTYSGDKLVEILRNFILLEEKDRKSAIIKKPNAKLSEVVYAVLEPKDMNNVEKISFRLSRAEREALCILAGVKSMKNAIIVALCVMHRLNSSQSKPSSSQHIIDGHHAINMTEFHLENMDIFLAEKRKFMYKSLEEIISSLKDNITDIQSEARINTGCHVMGNKWWYIQEHKDITNQIMEYFKDTPLNYIELFMGSGNLLCNTYSWHQFLKYSGNDADSDKIKYFTTIVKYASRFKSILICLDYSACEENKQYADKMYSIIIDSFKQYQSNGSSYIISDLVDYVEYWLQGEKISVPKTSSSKGKEKATATATKPDEPTEPKIKISLWGHFIAWVYNKLFTRNKSVVPKSNSDSSTEQPCLQEISCEEEVSDHSCDTDDVHTQLCVTINDLLNYISNWKQATLRKRKESQEKNLNAGKIKNAGQLKAPSLLRKLNFVGSASKVLDAIEMTNEDALVIARKNGGNLQNILVCDPPYIDTLGYCTEFNYEYHHKELAKILIKHSEMGGSFIYYGRVTAPRSLNMNAKIDYSDRDKVYKNKYKELFFGHGLFYKDFKYGNHGVIERVISSVQFERFLPLDYEA